MLILAFTFAAILVYTYFAYPVLVAVLARLLPTKLAADPGHTPSVSALIPVYNAENYIEEKVQSLLAQRYPEDKLEILLYSDASTDGSDEILQKLSERYPGRVRWFRGEARRGKPTALNAMRREARGDVLLMTDIRQPLVEGCLRALVSLLAHPEVGAVSGNLELKGGAGAGVYWKYEKWIRQSEARFRSLVGVTGAIYALRAADLPDLPVDITLDDMWVPMRLRLQGKKVLFAPGAIAYDEAFEDGREFSRKTRTLAGNYQLFARLPALLVPFVNPSWFETMSHKIMRLLCPWALLGLLISTLLVLLEPDAVADGELWLARLLLSGQVAFYALALAGRRAGKLGGVARTFVVLNVAAVVGLWRWLSAGQKITW